MGREVIESRVKSGTTAKFVKVATSCLCGTELGMNSTANLHRIECTVEALALRRIC